jgi:glycosyltransferase involved in cell wall biosynthesis
MELVSVIIPTYNRGKMIRYAVNSIIRQTYKELQLIIVDDGSTDNTEEIIASYKDSRIQYFKKTNAGISSTMNYGISKAEGKYIARLDSDDISVSNRIEIQYNFVKKNPDYKLIGSFFYVLDNKENITKVRFPVKHKHIFNQLPRKCCICQPSTFFSKELLLSVNGYNENKKKVEDWDLYLRLMDKTKFYNIPEYLIYLRKHDNNDSAPTELFLKENEEVPLSYFFNIVNSTYNKKRLAKANFDLGYFYYYENKFDKSVELFKKAIGFSPYNLQYLRYYFFNRHLTGLITDIRTKGWSKYWDFLRRLDKNNIIFKNKF